MNTDSIDVWILFNLGVVLLLWADLKLFHRGNDEIPVKAALKLSAFWITLALCFNVYVAWTLGSEAAIDFFTAYLIEKSLSVDNLFVFLLIFNYFGVQKRFQHRVLYYGILGALIMRGLFIFLGVSLLAHFEALIYILGLFLLISGAKLVKAQWGADKDEDEGEEPKIVELLGNLSKKLACDNDERGSFLLRKDGWLMPTRLLFVVITVELCDVIFALDSIPAVLAISSDPFIVYSSNVCAILGLRALFFALAGLMTMFRYLDHGLAIILMFVGAKMVMKPVMHLPSWLSLVCITSILAGSVILSILKARQESEFREEGAEESEKKLIGDSVGA
jgi:tellurite resistance protein TerC